MLSAGVIGLVILFLVALSVRERVRRQTLREKILSESKTSPLSQALSNLIGVAGGIYLSLDVISSFLELNIPDRVQIGSFCLEPLAALSILTAIAQPYMLRIIDGWKGL
ncbi:MAG TPA: hypothetical protein PK728_01280 [Bacillota bacterium]|nr:hypothetical protein [Bacillota bacterium]